MNRFVRYLKKRNRNIFLYSHAVNDHELDDLRSLGIEELMVISTGKIRSTAFLGRLERKYNTSDKLVIVKELMKRRRAMRFSQRIMASIRHTLGLDAKPERITKRKQQQKQPYHEVHFD